MLKPNKDNLCSRYVDKMLSIKLLTACNAKCSFCVDRGGYTPSKIDVEAIAKSAISKSDYRKVIITGGEPFLVFDQLVELIKLIRKHKSEIIVNTNGSLLTNNNVDKLNGLIDELQVSIHHFDKKKNCAVFGRIISFKKIKDSLVDCKFKVSINSTFNKSYTEEEKPQAIKKLKLLVTFLGADRLRLSELKKVPDSEFVPASDFISNEFSERSSKGLIEKGCTLYDGNISIKRLCKFAKGENAESFSCCFINESGQKKIDVDTVDTFKVIYSDGETVDDWKFNK